jgi:hypothetical protein
VYFSLFNNVFPTLSHNHRKQRRRYRLSLVTDSVSSSPPDDRTYATETPDASSHLRLEPRAPHSSQAEESTPQSDASPLPSAIPAPPPTHTLIVTTNTSARTDGDTERVQYNEVRPYSRLDYRTPTEFAKACQLEPGHWARRAPLGSTAVAR